MIYVALKVLFLSLVDWYSNKVLEDIHPALQPSDLELEVYLEVLKICFMALLLLLEVLVLDLGVILSTSRMGLVFRMHYSRCDSFCTSTVLFFFFFFFFFFFNK